MTGLRQLFVLIIAALAGVVPAGAQINTDQVMQIGRNTLYFEDYVLSIQYFNQVIGVKPYLAQPYFYRAVAKLNLEDYRGAEADATLAIERNPFITDAWEVRGVARQNLGDLAGAVADYDKALESLPDNRSLLYNRAMAQEELKDYDAARAGLDRLVALHPKFDQAYVGRARLNTVTGDTVAAIADAEKALELNPASINALLIHSDLMMNHSKDFNAALADMDAAIKLQPHLAGLFINRAFVRYSLNDYYGAMADYDYAVTLDPTNVTALYNRGLLRAEVHDTNRAVADFDKVLDLDPDNYRALFNRALLRRDIGELDGAEKDLTRLIEVFPDFAAAWFLRYDVRNIRGDRRAKADYDHSIRLAQKNVAAADNPLEADPASNGGEETQEQVKARFSTLLTVADNTLPDDTYNSKEIKGRVQDRRVNVELEPIMALTYYTAPTELKPGSEYIREVAQANRSGLLSFALQASVHPARMDDEDLFDTHNRSIAAYTARMAVNTPRALDYLGRAMDYLTLRNYDAAEADLSAALTMSPDYTLALLARAQTRYLKSLAAADDADKLRMCRRLAVADLDEALRHDPTLAPAWYNKGVILSEAGDFTSAIAAFNRAIELEPSFGEARYNRGYCYLRLGNRDAGLADLSKAGELGVVPSYNLLKRMSR